MATITANQLAVGFFNMAAGGYTAEANANLAVNEVATANAYIALPQSGLNSFASGGVAANPLFASALVARLMSGADAALTTTLIKFVVDYMAANPSLSRGAVAIQMIKEVMAISANDAVLGKAAAPFQAKVALADASTSTSKDMAVLTVVVNGAAAVPATTFYLTPTDGDTLTGTAGNDMFIANVNHLSSNDTINGGAGTDTLKAILQNTGVAITPTVNGVENITITAQGDTETDSGQNNVSGKDAVQLDFGRVSGVKQITNIDSRADVSVEDVRILSTEITKDITIAMRDTDPGAVDYAVYFDQNSLRNVSTSTSLINLRVLDTYAVSQGLAPLKDSPYGSFTFTFTANGGPATVATLASPAIQNAQTFAELVVALQTAANGIFGAGVVTVATGSTYTVSDSVTSTLVQGTEIVMSATGNITFDTTPAGSGWLATETVPAVSGLHTNFNTNVASTTALVTSTIILDNVGRGSNGGDLIVGGLSTGITSSSKGVQRFDITVEDNSKLSNILSTNNTLREVYVKNGTTDVMTDAYVTTQKDAGNLTVGVSNDQDSSLQSGTQNYEDSAFGFNDVRVIDGSTMTGKLAFTAAVNETSLAKYLNLTDTANDPAADNVAFVYTGGSNDDSMTVQIDGAVAASNTLSAREDFNFTLNGGAGKDALTVTLQGTGNWYENQAFLNNVTINGGSGNDTIKTLSNGDFVINAGTDNDTVYIGNDAAKSKWVVSTQTDISAAGVTTDLLGVTANATRLFLSDGKLTVIYSAPGIAGLPIAGGVMGDTATGTISDIGVTAYTNGLEVTVDIPTGANYAVTQYHINQAIKNAINNDAVLSKLLVAKDGPTTSLVIESLVDGTHVGSDLTFTVWNNKTYLAGDNTVLTAYQAFVQQSEATIANVNAAIAANVDAINLRDGMINDATAATQFFAGANSALTTDNVIDMGAGKDVLVLSTSLAANEVVKFTATSGIDSTVVNFSTGLVDNTNGGDRLDFTAYLTSKNWNGVTSSSTASQTRIATSLNADTDVEANSVTILDTINFNTTTTDTFVGLNAANFKSAINASGVAYAGITSANLNAVITYTTSGTTGLVDNLGKAIVMVENDDNRGEYKVFELTFKGQATTNAAADFDTVTLIGSVDFGASIDGATTPVLALANLV